MDHSFTTLSALQARYGPQYRWLVLLAVMVGTMAGVMSSTVISVALPAIGQRFQLGQADVQWINTLFMLAMTVSMLTTPWMLRRLGYRRTYVLMMWLLMAGGILGGFAHHFGLILLARLMEGIAAGVIQPIPVIIILRAFEPHEQGKASGIFGMAVVLAPAIGPSVGGLLVEWWSWRAIFWMVVPFCTISIWLANKLIPSTGPGGIIPDSLSFKMDWMGLCLVTLGILGLLTCVVVYQRTSLIGAVGLLTTACVFLSAFLWRQIKLNERGEMPLILLSLFRRPSYALGCFVTFVYGFALYGSTYLLAVYIQTGLQLSASQVGVVFLPAGLVLAITIGLAGTLTGKIPANRLIYSGQLLMAISFILMPLMDVEKSLFLLVVLTLVGRLGMGSVAPALNVSAMSDIENSHIPDAASTINFIRLLGGAIGMFSLGLVLDGSASHTGGGSFFGTNTFNSAFFLLAGLCAAGFFAALRITTFPTKKHAVRK